MKKNQLVLLIHFLILFLIPYPDLQAQNVIINELMARNQNGIFDEFGERDDWIEIFNPGSTPVNLAGLYIADTNSVDKYYRIPAFDPSKTTVPAGGYLILWADGQPAQGANHLPFKLDNAGEGVFIGSLSGGTITLINQVSFPKLERDVSYGRYPDATGNFMLLSDPTPGAANKPVRVIGGILINEVMAVNNGPDVDEDGEAEDWIEFYNPTSQPIDVGGLYLTDSIGELTMHRIPIYSPDSTTVPPGGYLRMWADAEPRTSIWHLDFRLSRSGEKITMTQPDGKTIMQEVRFPSMQPDASFGRFPDGSNNWIYLNPPTPNAPNNHTYQTIDGIVINEFLAINTGIFPDNLGEFEDWIELYNTNDYAVNVGGLIISDTLGEPMRCRIPTTYPDSTTIPPKGFLVFWADNQPEQGILHLDLKLTGEGEAIGLYQYRESLHILDSFTFGQQTENVSTGRSPDGADNWLAFSNPTPGKPNSGGSSLIISGLFINEFVARNVSGYRDEFGNIDDWIELYNSTDEPINIGGLYFTDDLAVPQMSLIPADQPAKTTVPPKGYLIVWPDLKPNLGPLHVNFQLAGNGEQIGIYQYHNGIRYVIDEVTYPVQRADVSYGRGPDGGSDWNFFALPTPMAPNPATGIDTKTGLSSSLRLYPNPSSSDQNVFLAGISRGECLIEIFSITGSLVFSQSVIVYEDTQIVTLPANWSEERIPAGMYYLKIVSGEQRDVLRMIVK